MPAIVKEFAKYAAGGALAMYIIANHTSQKTASTFGLNYVGAPPAQ